MLLHEESNFRQRRRCRRYRERQPTHKPPSRNLWYHARCEWFIALPVVKKNCLQSQDKLELLYSPDSRVICETKLLLGNFVRENEERHSRVHICGGLSGVMPVCYTRYFTRSTGVILQLRFSLFWPVFSLPLEFAFSLFRYSVQYRRVIWEFSGWVD